MKKLFFAIVLVLTVFWGFSQTPVKVREMSTDRPDVTESAYTVDRGHFQLETDLFKTEQLDINDYKIINNFFNLINLKYGISKTVDLQLVVESFTSQNFRIENEPLVNIDKGFGDISFRVKKNIWGNDEGKTALAIMPYLTFGSSKSIKPFVPEFGIIAPFAADINEKWGFGTQVQFSLSKDETSAYQPILLQSATFSRVLSPKFDAFVESFYELNLHSHAASPFINGGVVFSPTANLKFDAGLNLALKSYAADVYFLGFSLRY